MDGLRAPGINGRGVELVVVSLTFLGVAALMVGVRMATKRALKKLWERDDWLILAALVTSCGLSVANVLAVYYGFGKRSATLSLSDRRNALKNFWIVQILYKVVMAFTKLSILALYIQVFRTTNSKRFRHWIWFLMGFIILYSVASVMATIVQCRPVENAWAKTPDGKCWVNLTAFWYANATASIATDFATLLSPMPMIRGLHLPRRARFGLFLVFALGIFVCITSILRMTTLEGDSKASDQTYGTLTSDIWTSVEANTGIICACLPMLKHPLTKLWPRLFHPRGRSHSQSAPPNITRARTNSGAVNQSRFMSITKNRSHLRLLGQQRNRNGDDDIEMGDLVPPRRREDDHSTTHDSHEQIATSEDSEVPVGKINKTTDVDIRFDEDATQERARSVLS